MRAYLLADAFGYMSRPEVDALANLARKLPDKPVAVNVGAGVGTSAMALLEARPDLALWSIDVEGNVSPLGGLGNERLALDEHGIDYQGRHIQVCGDSANVAAHWDLPVDLVFLDGDKTRVGRDIAVWLPHVKAGGFLVCHDYGAPMWQDIRAVIDKALAKARLVVLSDTLAAFRKEGDADGQAG